jgi:LacI family transcriptional regulator
MLELPQRVYLSAQCAATLRQGIASGTWKEFLPSERRLCSFLRVSRPTVRHALHLLAREGWIRIRQGRPNEILARRRRSAAPRQRLILIVTREPVALLSGPSYHGISEMRAHLAQHGFTTEFFVCPPDGGEAAQLRRFRDFVRHNSVLCCVLLSIGPEFQRWCATHGVPALVLGSCHQSVQLPSLDIDHRAVGRHAAGMLLGKGHRRLALIGTDLRMGGDLATEEGFREAIARHRAHHDTTLAVVRAGRTRDLPARLDHLFDLPAPPTALFVAKPQAVVIVLLHLLRRGLQVPRDVSLIARDPDNLFPNLVPPVSHYSSEIEVFGQRMTRLMLQLVGQGQIPPEPHLVLPRFYAGGTVRPVS